MNIFNIKPNAGNGYIFDVNLQCEDKESTKAFPLEPVRKIVDFELYIKEQQE